MHDDIKKSEACAILGLTEEALRVFMCKPASDDLPELFTTRQLLAARIAMALLPLANQETAARTGMTAAVGAREGGNRLLLIAYPNGKDPEAFWRDAGLSFNVAVPGILVPADAWFDGMIEVVNDHRREAMRPN